MPPQDPGGPAAGAAGSASPGGRAAAGSGMPGHPVKHLEVAVPGPGLPARGGGAPAQLLSSAAALGETRPGALAPGALCPVSLSTWTLAPLPPARRPGALPPGASSATSPASGRTWLAPPLSPVPHRRVPAAGTRVRQATPSGTQGKGRRTQGAETAVGRPRRGRGRSHRARRRLVPPTAARCARPEATGSRGARLLASPFALVDFSGSPCVAPCAPVLCHPARWPSRAWGEGRAGRRGVAS